MLEADFVLYNVAPTSGTFVFSAALLKGHRLQWVLNYTDPGNYDLFQMDDKNFYRSIMRNGKKADAEKADKNDEKDDNDCHKAAVKKTTETKSDTDLRQDD